MSASSASASRPTPPTERERAVQALVAGAILGAVLALLGRRGARGR